MCSFGRGLEILSDVWMGAYLRGDYVAKNLSFVGWEMRSYCNVPQNIPEGL